MCKVFAPDYSNQEIFEVNFSNTEKQSFDFKSNSNNTLQALDKAIAAEDYEKASKIRDAMKSQ